MQLLYAFLPGIPFQTDALALCRSYGSPSCTWAVEMLVRLEALKVPGRCLGALARAGAVCLSLLFLSGRHYHETQGKIC